MESNQKKVSECSPDDRFTVDKIEGVWGVVRESETEELGYLIERKDDMGVWWLPADTTVVVIGVDVSNKELPVLPEGYKYTLCQVDGDKKEMSYEEACKWATEALEKEREEIRKGFSDMMIFGQEKYHVSKDGIEHIPVDPAVGPDTPISVIPAWGEVEKEAITDYRIIKLKITGPLEEYIKSQNIERNRAGWSERYYGSWDYRRYKGMEPNVYEDWTNYTLQEDYNELLGKVMQWYSITKNEKYAEHMGIIKQRHGKIE